MIAIMGLVSFIAGALALAFSNTVALVFFAGFLGMGARITDATLRSLISQVKTFLLKSFFMASFSFRMLSNMKLGKYLDLLLC